jgi:ubiquinone/menaquinone biosynthesis C-methylase UbiE
MAERSKQLAYSELMSKMLDENHRRKKAAKIIAVLQHFLGRDDLDGLVAVDLGCSAGYIADELRSAGARVVGLDIDVPGLKGAHERYGHDILFTCADGEAMPFADKSVDVIAFNHIYEHVVDADAIMTEIRRVLKDDGVAYFGFGNKLGVVEPHYRLPFLSWLPSGIADRYVAASGRADSYYERFRTRRGLRRMCAGLNVWDYTYPVLTDAANYEADDMVPPRLRNAPLAFWKSLAPIIPTFIWIGTPGDRTPAGQSGKVAPRRIVARTAR